MCAISAASSPRTWRRFLAEPVKAGLEDLDVRRVGWSAFPLVAVAGAHQCSAEAGVFGKRGDQVGLANPGLAADKHDGPTASHRILKVAGEQLELGFAADGRQAALLAVVLAGFGNGGHALQFAAHVGHICESFIGVLGKHAANDDAQRLRHIAADLGRIAQDRGQRIHDGGAAERMTAAEHFGQDDAQRELVGAGIEFAA